MTMGRDLVGMFGMDLGKKVLSQLIKLLGDAGSLALAEFVEVGEELGEADGSGFGSVDLGVTFCS